jgi:hypothetical protein
LKQRAWQWKGFECSFAPESKVSLNTSSKPCIKPFVPKKGKVEKMPIEQIAPTGSVDATTDLYSKAAADKSLEIFLANKKANEVAQAAKDAKVETAKVAQTAKDNRADEAEAFQEAKETRANAQAEKYAKADAAEAFLESKDTRKAAEKAELNKSDAAKLQTNKEIMEKTLAAKTDQAVVSRRAAKSAASGKANVAEDANSKVEKEQAIEAYQDNRAAQEVAQSDKAIETARLVDAGIIADSRSAAISASHIDLRD